MFIYIITQRTVGHDLLNYDSLHSSINNCLRLNLANAFLFFFFYINKIYGQTIPELYIRCKHLDELLGSYKSKNLMFTWQLV